MNNAPVTTYRIQFNPAFTFQRAKGIISYLSDLGISHVYASPVFQSAAGSVHGYDVVDPTRINPEIGSHKDFDRLIQKLNKLDMGWVQDIVPNHMAFHGENRWLMDVLEKGKHSAYVRFFDIEWKDTYRSLKGKVLVPFLGRFYSRCLEDREIQIHYDRDGLSINYYDLKLPVFINTYSDVLLLGNGGNQKTSGQYSEYARLANRFKTALPQKGVSYDDHLNTIKEQLWGLYTKNSKIKKYIDDNVKLLNGRKGDRNSFVLLDQLLDRQLFRLTFWKFGSEEINYRRFFNINQLISLHIEEKIVFERTHELILQWMKKGKIAGLRVDHIDGLYDPKRYLQRLRESSNGCSIVAEKILEPYEQLRKDWPIEGTTGYDFLNAVNGLFIDKDNEKRFSDLYAHVTGQGIAFDELVSSKKRLIIGKHMAGDVDNLAHHMKRISHKDRYGRDITSYGLKRALVEVLTFFPRYRTYIDGASVNEEDRAVILEAIHKAKGSVPDLVYELDFIEDILLLNFKDYLTKREKDHWVHFVRRFQQFTGPLMAKGFEDTSLYIYNRLLSLNEVGGNPKKFGISVPEFHDFIRKRTQHWPHTMNTTATHDTKRGEDIRARINVLSEIPDEWQRKVKTWQKMNRDHKTVLKGIPAPDSNDEYFLYQTLIGGYPFNTNEQKDFKQRLKGYMIKAVREAKVHTAWIQPDAPYEQACAAFIDKILGGSGNNLFLKDFLSFQKKAAVYGVYNSLAQTLVKLTAPGVADIYQGCELWDFHFVDPDNRGPVDFQRRLACLNELKRKDKKDRKGLVKELLKKKEDGRVKLFLIWKVLQFHRQNPKLYQEGRYIPLKTAGVCKEHIIAFARKSGNNVSISVAPRLLTNITRVDQIPVGAVWKDTRIILPAQLKNQEWRDVVSGGRITKKLFIRDLFRCFPAVLAANTAQGG